MVQQNNLDEFPLIEKGLAMEVNMGVIKILEIPCIDNRVCIRFDKRIKELFNTILTYNEFHRSRSLLGFPLFLCCIKCKSWKLLLQNYTLKQL